MDPSQGGFDPCECINILNHEARMQRLINMLRDSQSTCNDNECFQDGVQGLSLPGSGISGDTSSTMLMMFGVVMLALILYLFRPASLRGPSVQKPSRDRPSDRDDDDNLRPVL